MKTSARLQLPILILALTLLYACRCPTVTKSTTLPESNPQTEGFSSEGMITFLDSLANSKHGFHSIIILRHVNVIAKGWVKKHG